VAVVQLLNPSRIRNHLRLIALTGPGRQEDRDRVLDAGFDEHLVKPVEIDLLEKVLLD
jgi:DNA-binding response OmpR family regulator